MKLEVYVTDVQVRDSVPLKVGQEVGLELVGNPGSTVDTAVWPLDTYLSDKGSKALRRTGLAEYAFCGEIQRVETIEEYGLNGTRDYREILLDCGVPILFVTSGIAGMMPWDMDRPEDKNKEHSLKKGRYLRGLMMLHAQTGFRDPVLIERVIRVKITSIGIIEFNPDDREFPSVRPTEVLDSRGAYGPVVLGVEVAP